MKNLNSIIVVLISLYLSGCGGNPVGAAFSAGSVATSSANVITAKSLAYSAPLDSIN